MKDPHLNKKLKNTILDSTKGPHKSRTPFDSDPDQARKLDRFINSLLNRNPDPYYRPTIERALDQFLHYVK